MNTKALLITTIGLGAIGSSAGLSYWYSLPKNLKGLLESEGVKLLDVDSDKDDANWKKLAEKYQGEKEIKLKTGKVLNRIKDLKIDAPAESATIDFAKLKNECKKLFQKPITKDEEFDTSKQNAKDWCASDSDVLTKELETDTPSPAKPGTATVGQTGHNG